jgi:hypothetical protein
MWEAYCFYDVLEKLELVPTIWELHEVVSKKNEERND